MKNALALLALALAGCGTKDNPSWTPGTPMTVDVSSVFPAGTTLRDQGSGQPVTVGAGGTATLTPDSSGVVLLEKDGAGATLFTWADATVYFAVTDRFYNGDPSNDASYGRKKDGNQEVGTWHGGDLKGLTQKLDYIAALGATAIWISPPVEQVHGWVGGGGGTFQHYGYHGYWALDFTKLDQNFGTEADLTALVDGAHQRGIRVLFDVVMNHPGYATGEDLLLYAPTVFRDGTGAAYRAFTPTQPKGYDGWNDLVDYQHPDWIKWWSPGWIRAGIGPTGVYDPAGSTDQTRQLTFLPDFKTESTAAVSLPPMLATKGVTAIPNATVRDYLVAWHTDWVKRFGIDGFRCDTSKNVELGSWKALKTAATTALQTWKAANPAKKLDDAPFWMTAEVFPHSVVKDAYFTDGGFDSVINFDFQPALRGLLTKGATLAENAADLEAIYAPMAALISADPTFDVLSYLSSHDTSLFFEIVKQDAAKQRQAGTALLLAPGSAQIFYGDESGRAGGPSLNDQVQSTRSDMNWSSQDAATLAHWQKLGAFRKRHAAIGTGMHQQLASPGGTYAFSRKLQKGGVDDAVVVVIGRPQ